MSERRERSRSTAGMDVVLARAEAAAQGRPAEPVPVPLRDGSTALLRPIRADDKARVQRGLDLLSPRSRYLRFHRHVERLTDEQLRYVTEIDHRDHVAWVALDPDDTDGPGMGMASYVRLRHEPSVAEAAITVLDRYQGRGLGTVLLGILAEVARANGVRVFRNYVLADNEAMLELFDQLGASRQPLNERVQEVDLLLPEDLETLPDTPAGRALRALASELRGESELALTLPPVWIRRWRARRSREGPRPAAGTGAPPTWRERGPFADWLDEALAAADDEDGDDEA